MMRPTQTRTAKRRKKYRKILGGIISVLLFLMAVTVGGFYYLLHADFVPSAVNEDEPAIEEYMVDPIDKVNIMVLGVDRRNEDIGRSDTLFIVTADPDTKQLSMLSVPRDTRVLIPGYGYDKINHAYSLGGHKLTEKSVERLLNMPIDHYVLIDFKAFYKIIDALGGVDIYVDKRMYYEDPWDDNGGLVIDIQPGLQHMNGETAIQYVRYRDSEGDIGRVARQQKFLKAVMDRVASPSILTRIPTIIYEISSAVETDLSMGQMFSLAAMFKEAKDNGMRAYMVPGTPTDIDKVNYWVPDIEQLRESMANQMGVLLDAKHKAKNREEAEKYRTFSGGASDASDDVAQKSTVRMRIIDATGDGASPAKIDKMIADRRIIIDTMASSPVVSEQSLIICTTTDEHIVDEVKNLPFPYTLRIERDDNATADVVWIIGKDFL